MNNSPNYTHLWLDDIDLTTDEKIFMCQLLASTSVSECEREECEQDIKYLIDREFENVFIRGE